MKLDKLVNFLFGLFIVLVVVMFVLLVNAGNNTCEEAGYDFAISNMGFRSGIPRASEGYMICAKDIGTEGISEMKYGAVKK